MNQYESSSAKRPPLAWRITRVFLHITGKVLLWALVVIGTAALITAVAGMIFMTKFSAYLRADVIPRAEEYAEALELDRVSLAQTSVIYYTDPETGKAQELQKLYATENRTWVSYESIPRALVNATIAIEDKRFPDHNGVDWVRTMSAVKNFAGGDASYGASTITQQLIKNLSQEDDVTINRKVQEIFRALAVEERYSKKEIMEWYLNTIYLGEGCYGVQSAAETYFGKDVSELTTAECAAIIGITNNPSLYDPYVRPANNRKRQLTILREMYDQGYLQEAEYEQAKAQEMDFHGRNSSTKTYTCPSCGFAGTRSEYEERTGGFYCPECGTLNYAISTNSYYSYFTDTVYRDVINDLREKYGYSYVAAQQKLLTGGYQIYSTLNPTVQATVDSVYENTDNLPETRSIQQLQSAIVIIDNQTGDIIAMYGGIGKKEGNLTLNRATMSKLPTGSSIKPIAVYAPALEAGLITPASVIEDSPMTGEGETPWPQNYYRNYSGPCTILRGLSTSLNTISVKTLELLGLQNSYNFLTQKLGISTLVESWEQGGRHYTDVAYAPLGLGEQTFGLTVREMTQAFAVFPNNGIYRDARTYTLVTDAEGNVILDNSQESHSALGEKASFYMNYMLEYTTKYGYSNKARLSGMTSAGKTGTSSNNNAQWYAGYTPYYTAVVWCGYDTPEQIVMTDGSTTNPGITMWKKVMEPLHKGLKDQPFYQPSSAESYRICADCGLLAGEACEKDVRDGVNRVVEITLLPEDVPTEACTCHALVKICGESGKYATDYCELYPGNTVTTRGMLIYNDTWKVNKNKSWVFNPVTAEYCPLHTHAPAGLPTEPTTPTVPTEPNDPFEPILSLPPQAEDKRHISRS